jgi:PII-like signaling protein
MELNGEGRLLRIYIGESDRWHHKPLYQELVQAARRQGLAGATVLRGIEGFGASSRIHTSRILSLSEDLPLVIEIVDTADKVEAFLAAVDELLTEGLVTMERVEVRVYRARPTDR